MDVSVLETVTVVDVLLLILSVALAFTLYQCARSIDDRVSRTGGAGRATWFGLGILLLGGGLWMLGLVTTVPLNPPGPVRYQLLPALLSAALALSASAFALTLLQLEGRAWVRVAVAATLWGAPVPVILYLDLSGLGWRGVVGSDPAFAAQVLVLSLLGAGLVLWSLIAGREGEARGRWWRLAGAATAVLAAPAAVYVAATEAGGGAAARRTVFGLHFLLEPWGLLIAGGTLLLALSATLLAASLDRRLRQRREETEALRRSEDRFRTLIQASSQIVWTTDPEGEMLGEQASWAEFTGQDPASYRGWGWFNAVHPEDREATASVWQASLANHRALEVEHRVRRHDGVYRSCVARVVPVLEADGRVREWVGTHTDVTERARMQEERDLLASAGRVLSSSLDERETLNAIAGLLVPRLADWCAVDIRTSDGSLERVVATHADPHRSTVLREIQMDLGTGGREHGAVRVLVTGESELFREVDEDVLRTIASDAEDFRRMREVGVASLLAVPMIARRQVLGVLTLALAEEGEPYDLRDLALAEELARRSAIAVDNARLYSASRAAIDARDEVMSIVSHDLRNPLSTITMTSDLLLDLPTSPDEQRRHLQAIGRAAASMNRLIRDLLDAGQVENGQLAIDPRPLDPAPLAVEACESMAPMAADKDIRLTWEVQAGLPQVDADAARLQQVLSNLLGNAVKFVNEGGTIHVSVVRREGDVLFSVLDDGPGIPAEDLPRVFDRHWRGKETAHLGAGLGLAICRSIVQAHGGTIWVESDPGRGSAFHFTVPALPPGERETPAAVEHEAPADDEPETSAGGDQQPAGTPTDADVHLVAGDA